MNSWRHEGVDKSSGNIEICMFGFHCGLYERSYEVIRRRCQPHGLGRRKFRLAAGASVLAGWG